MSFTLSEIPVVAQAQTFNITLNSNNYIFTLTYRDVEEGGWTLGITDSNGNSIIDSIPLVTGANLLDQYGYLGILPIGTIIWILSDGQAPDNVPTYENLGSDSHILLASPS